MNKTKGFGAGSPASHNKRIRANKEAEMRKHVEETMLELRAQSRIYSGKIQNEIETIRRIDRLEPVDRNARMRACRMLKMFLGQYRVIHAMSDNIEAINSELELREMSKEFGMAVEEITGLINRFNRQEVSPAKMFDRLRKVMRPLQNDERLSEYDQMYDELIHMYPNDSQNDAAGISDDWLEAVISGKVSWDSVPETVNGGVTTQTQPQTTGQMGGENRSKNSEQDLRSMLDALNDALRGDK